MIVVKICRALVLTWNVIVSLAACAVLLVLSPIILPIMLGSLVSKIAREGDLRRGWDEFRRELPL